MKTYNKPEFYVEEFIPNVAVASCQRDFSDKTETIYSSQAITCLRRGQTTDYIFSVGGSGCEYQPNAIGWLAGGTYTTAQISQTLGYNIQGSGNNVTVPAGGGYYVIWGGGNHYGPATAEIVDIMINSY